MRIAQKVIGRGKDAIQFLLKVYAIVALILFGGINSALATNSDDRHSLIYDTVYYDPNDECLPGAVGADSIEGHVLPASEGGTGTEQHVTVLGPGGDGGVASAHYALTNVPPDLQNGMAGGAGAYGTDDPVEEQYYITMRWRTDKWSWAGHAEPTGSEAATRDFYANHPRILVTNTRTGKSVITAVVESGPAPWAGTTLSASSPPAYWPGFIEGTPTEYDGRVAGLSPETMAALEAATWIYGGQAGDKITFAWADDQTATPGPTGETATTGGSDCGGTSTSCGETALPLPSGVTPIWYNYHAHGTSVSYPTTTDGHNTVVHKGNDFGAESVANSTYSVGEAADVGVPAGTDVTSPVDGTVLYSGHIHEGGADGDMVIIESENKNCVATLAHTTNTSVAAGDTVTSGQNIGQIKDLGADHLHFEFWVDGEPINIGGPYAHAPFDAHAKEIWDKQKAFLTTGVLQ